MRIKGLRNTVSQNQLVSVLKRHLTKDQTQLVALAKQILNGVVIVLEDDWALEQDLKDLGVKVD
jgi:ribonuclease I